MTFSHCFPVWAVQAQLIITYNDPDLNVDANYVKHRIYLYISKLQK